MHDYLKTFKQLRFCYNLSFNIAEWLVSQISTLSIVCFFQSTEEWLYALFSLQIGRELSILLACSPPETCVCRIKSRLSNHPCVCCSSRISVFHSTDKAWHRTLCRYSGVSFANILWTVADYGTMRTCDVEDTTLRTRLWGQTTLRTCDFEDMRLWGQIL